MEKSEEQERKALRLKGYDYSRPGWYFVTVCTACRRECLCRIVGADVLIGPQVELSEYGKVVERVLSQMPTVDKYVIMPNHVHVIFHIPELQDGPMRTSAPTLPGLVRYWKRQITRQCGMNLWQRSYYDRVIRGEPDYLRILRYMDENPAKWTQDEYYPGGSRPDRERKGRTSK